MTVPYHPSSGGADPGKEPTAEETRKAAAKILTELEQQSVLGERNAGLRCPKCGMQLVHTRLAGYRCIRGCQ